MSNKDKWDSLDPHKRQRVIQGLVAGGAIIFALALYYGTGRDEQVVEVKEEVAVINVGEDRLEDDIRAQVNNQVEEIGNQNKAQNDAIEAQKKQIEKLSASNEAMLQLLDAFKNAPPVDAAPIGNSQSSQQWGKGIQVPGTNVAINNVNDIPVPIEIIGGISHVSIPPPITNAASNEKKQGRRFYLPVSFMPARVLTGLRAKTVNGSSKDPEPILLRVQAPAVLPNELRSNLEGCFVVAHGYGDLSSERVEARLVSLNCVDGGGEAVIEEEITGIVVDKDGVKGLAAHPVSKMGSNLARLAFASAIEGIGSAFSEQATTTSVNPLGSTSTINEGQLGRAGAGAAAEAAGSEYAKIIYDLVRQQAPVLEMGPGKDVVVTLTEGVWLNVRNYHEQKQR